MATQNHGEFPGEVIAIADGGVGTQTVAWWVAVDGVADAEDTTVGVLFGVDFVDGPQGVVSDLDF